MAELSLLGITKQFGAVAGLSDVNLEIAHREFVVIVGPSGCGKSTLLRTIAGLEQLSTGEIHVGGTAVHRMPAAKRGLAMVFQNYALYPHKTVAQNMGFTLKMAKVPKPDIDRRVADAARILQIEDLLERKPCQLSGGQRQRVAIGRAIVRQPKVSLFDEPLSNLDAALRVDMRVEFAKLHNSLDATMIYVTHDQVESMTMADKIVVRRAGRIEQVGSPLDLYEHSVNTFVAGFIGAPRMNLVPATVAGVSPVGVTLAVDDGIRIDVPLRPDQTNAGARVTFLHIATDATWSVDVYVADSLGGEAILYGHIADARTLVVKAPGITKARKGKPNAVTVPPDMCHVFDENGTALKAS